MRVISVFYVDFVGVKVKYVLQSWVHCFVAELRTAWSKASQIHCFPVEKALPHLVLQEGKKEVETLLA